MSSVYVAEQKRLLKYDHVTEFEEILTPHQNSEVSERQRN